MGIAISDKALEILAGQYSGIMGAAALQRLVEETWMEVLSSGRYASNVDDTQRLFALPTLNNRQNAVLLLTSVRDDEWTAFFVMYRNPGAIHPRYDKDPFSDEFFRSFPGLRERLDALCEIRDMPPRDLTGHLDGPESLDPDEIANMIDTACAQYTEKPYLPGAYGFSEAVWKDSVLRHLLDGYAQVRASGRILRLTDDLHVSDTHLTNANTEWLYLFYGTHKGQRICRLYPPRTVHLDFPDFKNTFYAFATRMHEKQKSYSLLGEWAFIHDDEYRRLESIILPEKWHFDRKAEGTDNLRPIKRYVEATFVRLLNENKLLVFDERYQPAADLSDARCAVFNTGLVDSMYRSIYALFRRNSQDKPIWKLDVFSPPNEGATKPLPFLPDRAQYFKTLQDMFYDMIGVPNARTPDVDHTHVLFDRFERLPLNVQKRYLADRYPEYRHALSTNRRDEAQSIVDSVPPLKKQRLKDVFDRALEMSLHRAEWNYRTGVPMYYVRDGIMTMLLPLAMENELSVDDWEHAANLPCDLALVMALEGQEGNRRYKAKTILCLDMAYANARLVTRPDSDWLNPQQITTSGVVDDD